jgi:hypothetical protein
LGLESKSSIFFDPIVLKRLPNFVRDELPWDWEWPFDSVYLDRVWTRMFRYDVIKRQGAKNLVEKVMISGAKTNDVVQVEPLPNTSPSSTALPPHRRTANPTGATEPAEH